MSLSPVSWILLLAAFAIAAGAFMAPDPQFSLVLTAVAMTLACLLMVIAFLGRRTRKAREDGAEYVAELIAQDTTPSFTTDADGLIGQFNPAAAERFGNCDGRRLVRALEGMFANPSAVLYRLQNSAMAVGAAREEVVTRRGHVRLSVHRLGAQDFLWRLDEMQERGAGSRGAETLSLPMLTASKSGTILFMNDSLRRVVGGRVRRLDRIFPYLPLRTGEETEISGIDGPMRAIVAELEGASGRREIYLLPVSPEDSRPSAARAGFEDLPVALLKLSPEGQLLETNRFARDLLGFKGEPDSELRLDALLEGPGRPILDWLSDAMAGLTENRPETVRARKRGEDTFLQVTLRRISEDGRPGILAVLYDATALKTLETQFTQSQKMQAIGQLAGGIAHDFNNLLTAISGHCDLLLLRHDRDDPNYADLMQIHQNANRAASLVGQLLAFSRKQTMTPEVFDLREALSDMTHLLNRLVGERVDLRLRHDPELRAVRADKRQIEQVLMNLVVNARDAMPDGGAIVIETENLTLREELRRDRAKLPPGDYVVLRVTDEGTGIPAEELDKVFVPFFTTKRAGEGTGLGLSTVYGIVKQSGGFIFVDSEPGNGSVFSMFLPVCEAVVETELETEADPAPAEPNHKASGVILLVEDEAPVRAFASRALRLKGYTVLEAESAEDALQALQDPELHVDLVVTDVVMPGMDGPSLVREARRHRPDARVVFVSGYAEEVFSPGDMRIPNAVFLPKPFSLSELTSTVQKQLH